MPPTKPITLEDLPAAERERLLAEAAGKIQTDADAKQAAASAIAEKRTAAIAALMDDRDHARGCPVGREDTSGGRVEAYGATRPARPDRGEPAKPVTVVRCIECGGSTVLEQSYETTIAGLVAGEDDGT